jgi:hypothetical protein
MANSDDLHEERLVIVAYDERVKDLFKVFSEGLAQGEPERSSQDRFRRALRYAKRARNWHCKRSRWKRPARRRAA